MIQACSKLDVGLNFIIVKNLKLASCSLICWLSWQMLKGLDTSQNKAIKTSRVNSDPDKVNGLKISSKNPPPPPQGPLGK